MRTVALVSCSKYLQYLTLSYTKQGNFFGHSSKMLNHLIHLWISYRAERIHTDVLYFLGDASKAYNEHFSGELRKLGCTESLGPSVILFHETRYTNVLPQAQDHSNPSPETVIRDRLMSLQQVARFVMVYKRIWVYIFYLTSGHKCILKNSILWSSKRQDEWNRRRKRGFFQIEVTH